MPRDWIDSIDDLGSRIRRFFESARAQTLPPHLRFDQEDIHEKEQLLAELQNVKSEMLHCIALALTVDQHGVRRPLSRREAKDFENSLLAISVLRSGELMGGGRLFLDRTKLPTRLSVSSATEPPSLGSYADEVERLNARIQDLISELRQLQTEFDSERAST